MRLKLELPQWLHGRTIVAALLVAAILHIALTLGSVHVSARRGFDAASTGLPINRMQTLPPIGIDTQFVPFQTPDMRYAVCRFDAVDGSILVRASLPGLGWSLSLHSSRGDNFFVISGQDGRRTDLSLLLVPQTDEFVPLPREASGAQSMSQIPLPERDGLVIIRGPLHSTAYRAEVEAELARASCVLRRR